MFTEAIFRYNCFLAELNYVQYIFWADTGNKRKIVNFTYNCLYARPIILKTYTNYKLLMDKFLKILEIAKQPPSNF